MRPSAAAMNSALTDFLAVRFSTQQASLYESYLTAAWLAAHSRYPDPQINDVNEAVSTLFEVLPDEAMGRLRAPRYGWLKGADSGRKTIWNNTTRQPKLATKIFNREDLREGLRGDAAEIVAGALEGRLLPSLQALAVLLLRDHEFGVDDSWDEAEMQLGLLLGLSPEELELITDRRTLGVDLLGEPTWAQSMIPTHLAPSKTIAVEVATALPNESEADPTGATIEMVLDTRTERMLMNAIRSAQFIVLVGPPGSGKGTLVKWLTEQVTASPTAFGFPDDFDPNPVWRTPDESWSSFELIGGLAPDATGTLQWSDGLLAQAIEANRWLVLDETNRTDLDKIMGPVLTWMSHQEVDLGQSAAFGGTSISIGWTPDPTSSATDPIGIGRPTEFRAGTNFRLIGTYNPLDAQRVFRMGQALSRRFVTIPIPALDPERFNSLLEDQRVASTPRLTEDSIAAISGIYSAHFASAETLLGPAIFLRMAEIVGDSERIEAIAEAYVISVGRFIAAFDDATFIELGARVVNDEGALPPEEWEWISNQRLILG